MIERNKRRIHDLLRWSERYTKTDMVYFARGNFWLMLSRMVSMGAGFGLTIVLANALTPTDFGIYKYILATAGLIGAFSLNGLSAALTRALNRGQQNVIPSTLRTGIIWSIPSSVVALTIGGYYFVMDNMLLGWALVAIALTNPFQTNLTIAKSLFSSTGDFKRATYYNSVRNIMQVAVIIGVVMCTESVLILATTYLVVSVVMGAFTYWRASRALHITNDPTHHTETITYAKHMSVLGGLQLAVAQVDNFLLWHFAGPVALATYAIAQGPARELRMVADNIAAVALPKIAQKEREDARAAVREKSKRLVVVYVLVAMAYACAAPWLFALLFPQYETAVLPSQILAFGLVFQTRALADVFFLSHGTVGDRYRITLPSQLVRLVAMCVLIPLFGLPGAVAGSLISEAAVALALAYAYRRSDPVKG